MANNLMRNKPKTVKKTILLVDDDEKTRMLLREILKDVKYNLLDAQNGREALDLIHRQPIDLIITDRDMPGMDGLELLKRLKEENRTIPTLMVSGYGDEELWASAIGLGAEDYILKPFSSESVMTIVKKKLND